MQSFRSLVSDYKSQIFVVAGAILIVGIVGAVVFAKSRQDFLSKQPQPAVTKHTAASDDSNESTPSASVANSTSDAAAATTRTQPAAQPAPTTAPAARPTTQQNPQLPTPFTISHVSLGGTSWTCSGGGVVVYVMYASVGANNPSGGTFTWQLEETGAASPITPYPMTGTIPYNHTAQFLKSTTSPGYLYSTTYARDGQSVRVHVTSPSDVASPWFTVPAGSQASCANS